MSVFDEIQKQMTDEAIADYKAWKKEEPNEEQMFALSNNLSYIHHHGLFDLSENSRYMKTKRKLEMFHNRPNPKPLPGDHVKLLATMNGGNKKYYGSLIVSWSEKYTRLLVCTQPYIPFITEVVEPRLLIDGLRNSTSGSYFQGTGVSELTLLPEKMLRPYNVWADYPKGNGALNVWVPAITWYFESDKFY